MSKDPTQKQCTICGARLNNGVCSFCAADDSYIKRDIEQYNEIDSETSDVSFKLALALVKNIELWEKAQRRPVEHYFMKLEKEKGLRLKSNSLKQAYYVGRAFPDLLDCPPKKRLSFSCYREIATAGISQETKEKIRLIAEEERMKRDEVRRLIKRECKNEWIGNPALGEEIIYLYDEDFMREIAAYLERHRGGIKRGTIVILKYRNKRRKKK
jgi:hypothetical protein